MASGCLSSDRWSRACWLPWCAAARAVISSTPWDHACRSAHCVCLPGSPRMLATAWCRSQYAARLAACALWDMQDGVPVRVVLPAEVQFAKCVIFQSVCKDQLILCGVARILHTVEIITPCAPPQTIFISIRPCPLPCALCPVRSMPCVLCAVYPLRSALGPPLDPAIVFFVPWTCLRQQHVHRGIRSSARRQQHRGVRHARFRRGVWCVSCVQRCALPCVPWTCARVPGVLRWYAQSTWQMCACCTRLVCS